MERLVNVDVVVIPFPFSDLTGAKKATCVSYSGTGSDDVLMCQITRRSTWSSAANNGSSSQQIGE